MWQIALPVAYALLVWWFSTGIILYAIGLNRRTYPWSLTAAGVLLVAALWALHDTANGATPWDALIAFTGAVVVWGFVELTFLTGMVTGSRRTACPAGAIGWQRARYATETIIHHELALVAAGASIAAATWNGSNRIAIATFAILWVMRLSSKLNLFLGVRTLNDELLPRQLQHLRSYFRRSRMNALYPVSIIGSAAATVWLVTSAFGPSATDFHVTGMLLLASLLALALIEHLFMMIPMPIARLWGLQQPSPPIIKAPEFKRVEPNPIKPT